MRTQAQLETAAAISRCIANLEALKATLAREKAIEQRLGAGGFIAGLLGAGGSMFWYGASVACRNQVGGSSGDGQCSWAIDDPTFALLLVLGTALAGLSIYGMVGHEVASSRITQEGRRQVASFRAYYFDKIEGILAEEMTSNEALAEAAAQLTGAGGCALLENGSVVLLADALIAHYRAVRKEAPSSIPPLWLGPGGGDLEAGEETPLVDDSESSRRSGPAL